MPSRLYSNENFPLQTVEELRRLGHDLTTMLELGVAGQALPDEKVLAAATAEGRIVLTLNRRDFIRLHQDDPNHAGIIVCTVDNDFVALAQRIHEALFAIQDPVGKLIRVNRPNP